MKKSLFSLVAISVLFSNVYADDISDMKAEIQALTQKISKLEKKQKHNTKKISHINKLANNDNLKFNVDLRTSYDYISYKLASGKTVKNDGLYANRLWLNMGYAPTKDIIFKGQLAFNKAFGADGSVIGQRGAGYDTSDWVTNEALTGDELKVRQAYVIWMPTLNDRGYVFSFGRRPATNGYLVNLREDDKAQSPIGHIINMEFDGFSATVKTDDLAEGSYFKVCAGRGLTNAKPMFTPDGQTYAKDTTKLDNMDLVGAIAQLYNDGQYSAMATYFRVFNAMGAVDTNGTLATVGDMDGAAISAMSDGIGDGISDFLDDTKIFASFAWSKSLPDNGKQLFGTTDSKTGTSIYIGTQMPNLTGGKFGLEYNHGSKYWRSFTYGEDTMIGSKLAVRGDAYEAYWTQPLVKNIISMQIRYTYMDYKYTGSNGFFGIGGAPMTMSEAITAGQDPVSKAQDVRVYLRYKY